LPLALRGGYTDQVLGIIASRVQTHGVEFFVCGQYLAAEKIDPKTITPDVTRATDALLVLMQYQNKGLRAGEFLIAPCCGTEAAQRAASR
jgi:hypothetical protein